MVSQKDYINARSDKQLLDAQVSIIGSMLIDSSVVGEVILACKSEDFTNLTYRTIFNACKKVYGSRRPVDPVLVIDEIGKEYTETVMEIMNLTPTAANWKHYAEVLHKEATVQKINGLAYQLMNVIDLEEASKISDQINNLFCEKPGVKVVSFEQGLMDFFNRHGKKEKPKYLYWGFPKLNGKLFVEPGDMIILGGRQSSGKTMLAVQLAWDMAVKDNRHVGIFSYETRDSKLYDRLICRASGVDYQEIKTDQITNESWDEIIKLGNQAESVKIDVIPSSGMTVQDIRSISLAQHFDVVYIDYLQLISVPGNRPRQEEVAKISRDLHVFSQSTGITVIALSQLSRGDKKDENAPPRMSDLRESGQIEQDADVIMFLYSVEAKEADSNRMLYIAKNKEGGLGGFELNFQPRQMQFTELSNRNDFPPPRRKEPPLQKSFFEDHQHTEEEAKEVFANAHRTSN